MQKKHPPLTAERLRESLSYDPQTGIFRWKVKKNYRALPGAIAGSVGNENYILIGVDRILYRAHRLAWLYVYGAWPAEQLDHINGVTDDNRIENLREATNAQNHQNESRRRTNKSGYPGVTWDVARNQWRADIKFQYRPKNLGRFDTIEEAVAARAKAKAELHTFQPFDRETTP